MKIIAVDQARHGGWALFDAEGKVLLEYGVWSFESRKCSFEQAISNIADLIDDVIHTRGADIVFFEDIQLRQNVQSFKKLAQLQGALVYLCESRHYKYHFVAPSQWQNFCNARGRTDKEIRAKAVEAASGNRKDSKILSLQFVKERFGIETDNDNLSDAISMGWYVVNHADLTSE